MKASTSRATVRLLPVILLIAAAATGIHHVQAGGPYVLRNLIPPAMVALLCGVTLWRGGGRWTGAGWHWLLGTVGFAVPTLGLSLYLHYAYSVNLDGMFSDADRPLQLFRFLPAYTLIAGGIGFSIGWIAGRNI